MTGAISDFEKHLWGEEKCKSTVDKYVRDAGAFCMELHNRPLTKEFVIKYKAALCEKFKPAGVNSRLVAINRFLQFTGRQDCCVKLYKNSAPDVCQRKARTDGRGIQKAG